MVKVSYAVGALDSNFILFCFLGYNKPDAGTRVDACTR